MQHLDKNTLFSIFEADDEAVYREHEVEEVLNNPYVLMGMVLKGLKNFELIDIMYTRSYKEQYTNIRRIVKHKYYSKLVSYLERIDHTKFESIYTIGESFDTTEVLEALQELLSHFEQNEHYSKCSIIKNYHDLIAGVLIQRELSVNLL